MLTISLLNHSIPQLQLNDTIAKAIHLMQDYHLTQLPVVSGDDYLGMVSEDDLLETENDRSPLENLQTGFLKAAVPVNSHFLDALALCKNMGTAIIPVVGEENRLEGVITIHDLLLALADFTGACEPGGIIVLEMEQSRFSLSEISRITESNDATVLHLNTQLIPDTGLLIVTIQVNKKEIAAIMSGFERYEYDVVSFFGHEKFENEINSNYRHLMNYLDI